MNTDHTDAVVTRLDGLRRQPSPAVGPTPVHVYVQRELARLAEAWGAADRGWTATREGGQWVFRAYVGRPTSIVAMVGHHDLRAGLARLLASLFECDGK